MRLIDAVPISEELKKQYVKLMLMSNEEKENNDYMLRGHAAETMARTIAIVKKDLIDPAPTIEAEPVRHGHWIYHPDDLFPCESKQECSICHAKELFTLNNENYCPNCGAKMDGDS